MSIRAFLGLGATQAERDAVIADNARSAASYQAALAAWQAARALFEMNMRAYKSAVAAQDASYQQALRSHESALVAWRAQSAAVQADNNARAAAYGAAKRARDAQIEQNRQNALRVLGTTPMPGALPGQGYCATAAQRAEWVKYCAPVRGLGAAVDCVYQNLAVCSVPPLPPVPMPAGAPLQPPAPVRPAAPRPPVDPGPAPVPAKLKAVPALDVVVTQPPPLPPPPVRPPGLPDKTPVPPSLPEPPDFPPDGPAPQQSMAVWGLLAAVAVVGGGAYWYTHRKKAA